MSCNETERRLSGEFDVFAIDCSQKNALAAKAKGAPIGYRIPSDAPMILYVYAAVPRHAAHPNAAKLWVNYLVSREAQDILYEVDFRDSHLVPGSKTAQEIDHLRAEGVTFLISNLESYQSHDQTELVEVRQQAVRILNKRQ